MDEALIFKQAMAAAREPNHTSPRTARPPMSTSSSKDDGSSQNQDNVEMFELTSAGLRCRRSETEEPEHASTPTTIEQAGGADRNPAPPKQRLWGLAQQKTAAPKLGACVAHTSPAPRVEDAPSLSRKRPMIPRLSVASNERGKGVAEESLNKLTFEVSSLRGEMENLTHSSRQQDHVLSVRQWDSRHRVHPDVDCAGSHIAGSTLQA